MQQKPTSQTRFLDSNGNVRPQLRSNLTAVLEEYAPTARFLADRRGKEPQDYTLREIYVIGSTLRGVDNSDLDLLLIGDKLDEMDYRFIKLLMAEKFFTFRQKFGAIDVYVRPCDEFPSRPSFDITDQVRDLINACNTSILKGV